MMAVGGTHIAQGDNIWVARISELVRTGYDPYRLSTVRTSGHSTFDVRGGIPNIREESSARP